MQVRVEDVSAVEKKLIVSVPWATVNEKLLAAFKELGRSVQLKGFRKGKVPKSVLERMFGRRVRAEVAGQLVQESFVSAATEHKLEVVSQPVVQDSPEIKKGEPFLFEAVVEVRGDVEAENYRGMELTKRTLEITDEAVEQSLEQLQREHTELRPIEGRTELATTDFVAISLKGTLGDKDIEQPQLTVDLGDASREQIPGLVEALVGLATDAKDHELSYQIPEGEAHAELVGKDAKFTVTVLDARQKDTPQLDDEFAKDTEEAETLDELRTVLRGKLEERAVDEIQSELRQSALAELIKRNQIAVASSLVERAAQYKEQRFRQMLGMGDDDSMMNDDLIAKLREGADDEVRGQLLVDAVSKQEEITVTDEELDERIAKMAGGGQGAQTARARAEMERDGRLDGLRYQLLSDKTLDFIIERATVSEADPESASAGPTGEPEEPSAAEGPAAAVEEPAAAAE